MPGYSFFFHDGTSKDQQRQPPDQYSRYKMDHQIEDVIADHIKMAKLIIKCKGQEGNETAGPVIPNTLQVKKVPDRSITGYIRNVIEMERTKKAVGVDNGP